MFPKSSMQQTGFNPNDHLVHSNRAYCYYHLKQYRNANMDIKECLRLQPTFSRGWYQYALILEQFIGEPINGKPARFIPKLAAIAWDRVWIMVILEKNQRGVNACVRKKHKFWKSLEENDAINEDEIEKFAEEFWKKPYKVRESWQTLISKYAEQDPEIKRLSEKHTYGGRISDELGLRLLEVAEEETLECLNFENFVPLFRWSQFRDMVDKDAFERACDELICERKEGHQRPYTHWFVGWTSTPVIEHHKRRFQIKIRATDILIHQQKVIGRPTAEQVIDILYQAMTFSSIAQVCCVQPQEIRISWCMHEQFEAIQQAMGTLGIVCRQQSRIQYATEEAAILSGELRRGVDGYQHLSRNV